MAVLQRKELEKSPLADLHAIASELGPGGLPQQAQGRPGRGDPARPGRGRTRTGPTPPMSASPTRFPRTRRSSRPQTTTRTKRKTTTRTTSSRTTMRRTPWRRSPRSWTSRPPRRRSSPACSTSCPNGSGFLRSDPAAALARRRLRVTRPDPPLRAALRRRGQRSRAPGPAQRAPSVAGPCGDGERRGRRAARRALLVRRPHTRLPVGAPRRARGARGRSLRPRLARRDRRSARRRAPPHCCARSRPRWPRATRT